MVVFLMNGFIFKKIEFNKKIFTNEKSIGNIRFEEKQR